MPSGHDTGQLPGVAATGSQLQITERLRAPPRLDAGRKRRQLRASRTQAERERRAPTLRKGPRRPRRRPQPPCATPTAVRRPRSHTQPSAAAETIKVGKPTPRPATAHAKADLDAVETTQTGPSDDRASRRRKGIRVGAVLAVGFAAGFVAWLVLERTDDETSSVAGTTAPASTATTPAVAEARPAIASVAELRKAAASSAVPVYWVGARDGTRIEPRALPAGRSSSGTCRPRLERAPPAPFSRSRRTVGRTATGRCSASRRSRAPRRSSSPAAASPFTAPTIRQTFTLPIPEAVPDRGFRAPA